jgi:hypothetical protein
MNDSHQGANEPKPLNQAADGAAREVVDGIVQVIQSALGVGAALTRLAAEATGSEKGASPAATDPIGAMVHYGLATVRNVAGGVAGVLPSLIPSVRLRPTASSETTGAGQNAASTVSQGAGADTLPSVHQGATLRIPLSVENPSDQPLLGLMLRCEALEFAGQDRAAALNPGALRFVPAALSIAPRDFEKLTVFIDVPATAAPGRYVARIDAGEGDFAIQLGFHILADVT